MRHKLRIETEELHTYSMHHFSLYTEHGGIIKYTSMILMVCSFRLGIPGTRNVYIGMSVLLVVTSGNKS